MDLKRQSLSIGTRPALIVVDMIYGFTDPKSPLGSDARDVISAHLPLLDIFRQKSLPVFFTTTLYRHAEDASVFRARLPALDILQPDSRWVAIDEALSPQDDEPVIEKKWASGFFDTDLADHLLKAGANSLVITGLTTSGCVRATALDGLQHNYPVFIPREAVGDRNIEAHKANLHDLHAKYADVCSANDIISWLA